MFDKTNPDISIPGVSLFYQKPTDYLFLSFHMVTKDPVKETCCGVSDCVNMEDLETYAMAFHEASRGLTREFMLRWLTKRVREMKEDHKASCKKNH